MGTGYNYFLACDTAERIIFTIVTGSGSGKLCRHSRGNDNDQENAGYVRESAGGGEQVLRAEEVQKRSFCRRSFPPFLPLLEEMGPSETKETLAPGRETIPVGDKESAYAAARRHLIRHGFAVPPVSLRVGRFAGLTRHRRVIQYRDPSRGKANGGVSFNTADSARGRLGLVRPGYPSPCDLIRGKADACGREGGRR